jgi:hypothetical protein
MKNTGILTLVIALSAAAQTPTVTSPSSRGVSQPLRTYAAQNPTSPNVLVFGEGEESEIANQHYIPRNRVSGPNASIPAPRVGAAASPMANQTSNLPLPATVSKSFVGLGTGFNGTWTVQGLLPPDTTLAVGTTQIVQWVNVKMTILDKSTGATVLPNPGYVNANQIWAGLGPTSVCSTQNQGDPVVQYDRLANRWLLSQFAFTIGTGTSSPFRSYPAAPYAMCFAVSQTSDATGAYNLYEYIFSNLPDYPKIGVWPDAYYFTDNSFAYNTASGLSSYAGSRVCALDRAAMIAGNAATSICFASLDPSGGTHFAMLPGDFEGTIPPPANQAAYILSGDWFSKISPPYILNLRRFKPDFTTPANSTFNDGFGGAFDSFVSLPFDNSVIGACGDNGGACVTQPGTSRRLDTLSMRPMYRLAYRNMGANRESLVFTQTVDPTGGAVAGIQLVEIRNPAANPPTIYNNVTFNPDTTNRWMGAAATDKLGNVGLGYSVSSTAVNPGIRINGRLRGDMRNTLRGETNVVTGSGSQTSSAQRWGDYSTMQIDPSDDCTFWFTTEYMVNTSAADWATRIIGFKFNNCQ